MPISIKSLLSDNTKLFAKFKQKNKSFENTYSKLINEKCISMLYILQFDQSTNKIFLWHGYKLLNKNIFSSVF